MKYGREIYRVVSFRSNEIEVEKMRKGAGFSRTIATDLRRDSVK